jgi:hypothetical protein
VAWRSGPAPAGDHAALLTAALAGILGT